MDISVCICPKFFLILQAIIKVGANLLKSIVIYSSRGGNTKRVAEAIASELSCSAVKITKDKSQTQLLDDFDLVWVST